MIEYFDLINTWGKNRENVWAAGLKPQYQMVWGHIQYIRWVGSYLCRDTICIFYSPSWMGFIHQLTQEGWYAIKKNEPNEIYRWTRCFWKYLIHFIAVKIKQTLTRTNTKFKMLFSVFNIWYFRKHVLIEYRICWDVTTSQTFQRQSN